MSLETYQYEMSEGDMGSIFSILRDKLYKDKPLAVLREYACNAMDAHREAGIPDRPIQVTLPTYGDKNLVVRDFGRGLSPSDVINVFRKYGKSTKKDSNETIGFFGIGAKSGHAYSSTFHITSHHAGVKTVYRSVVDERNIGFIEKLSEEPTSETGVEIKVPIQERDIDTFRSCAEKLFYHFTPHPELNVELAKHDPSSYRVLASEHGYLRSNSSWYTNSAIAVMGGVPYEIDPERCGLNLRNWSSFGINLFFPLGSVDVVPSREELEYTQRTIQAVKEKFNQMVEGCRRAAFARIDSQPSGWAMRMEYHRLHRHLPFSIDNNPNYDWVKPYNIALTDGVTVMGGGAAWFTIMGTGDAKKLSLVQYRGVRVDNDLSLLVATTTARNIRVKHYHLHSNHRIICPLRPLKTNDEIQEFVSKVREFLDSMRLDGLEFHLLEEIRRPPQVIEREEASRKRNYSKLLSYTGSGWEAVKDDQVPEIDFYFPVFRFQTQGVGVNVVQTLHELARACGYDIPKFVPYGVKVTETGTPKEEMDIPTASEHFNMLVEQLKADPHVHDMFKIKCLLLNTTSRDTLLNPGYTSFLKMFPLSHPVRKAHEAQKLMEACRVQARIEGTALVAFYREYIADEPWMRAAGEQWGDYLNEVIKDYPLVPNLLPNTHAMDNQKERLKKAQKEYTDFLKATYREEEHDFSCPDQPAMCNNYDRWTDGVNEVLTKRKCRVE